MVLLLSGYKQSTRVDLETNRIAVVCGTVGTCVMAVHPLQFPSLSLVLNKWECTVIDEH